MKNLELLGVQEMDAKEMVEVEGGILLAFLFGVLIGYAVYHSF